MASQLLNCSQVPPAYICTYSGQVMEDPVLALCGHLFDREVLRRLDSPKCPRDQFSLVPKNCILLEEVKNAIGIWKEIMLPQRQSSHGLPDMHRLSLNDRSVIPQVVRPTNVVRNAHLDDIHGFVRISQDCFVSGSKDTCLKIWDLNGNPIRSIRPNKYHGYEYWVTALCPFSNGTWASGTRDGWIDFWNPEGQHLLGTRYQSPTQHNCKDRNVNRIHCISELEAHPKGSVFYYGTAGRVHLRGTKNKHQDLKTYFAHQNDWIYCIDVLKNRDLIVVIGPNLEFWKMKDFDRESRSSIIREKRCVGSPRNVQFISAITHLEGNPDHLSAAMFDGSVRIIDLTQGLEIKKYQEHQRRVWSVINLSPQHFASSADDATVKIWDIRTPKSAITIDGNPGRVSSLMKTGPYQFISGSCLDDVRCSSEKAQIAFWDLRMLFSQNST